MSLVFVAMGVVSKRPAHSLTKSWRCFHAKRLHRRKDVGDEASTRILSDGGMETPTRSAPRRFFNPWHDLADVCEDPVLSDKVDSVTRTFGVVAALMCSLSAALLAVNPLPPEAEETSNPGHQDQNGSADSVETKSTDKGLIEHVALTEHVSGTSLLVSWGVPPAKLHDIYMACCAGSFYGGVGATGLSAVLNAWLAATPPGGARVFVKRHSVFICTIPALLGISTGLAGVALFIGLDRSKGTPISYIGLGGTVLGGALIGSSTLRGWLCTYRLLARSL